MVMAERRPAHWRPLGVRVAAARRTSGLTQEQLAERLGTGQGFVANVERGIRRPAAEEVATWARVLGLSAGELLVLAGYVPAASSVPEHDHRDELDRRWDALPAWLKRVAIRAVDAFLEERPRDSSAQEGTDEHR